MDTVHAPRQGASGPSRPWPYSRLPAAMIDERYEPQPNRIAHRQNSRAVTHRFLIDTPCMQC
ncbi:hypothetical protein BC938DRAFT_481241 [Jimgerdemannia flammicorona]|uniref:Uncharacterized protein n=1 Tax=Jimgerdemannia flammicorona TaxID=994334 RepID=A0A433QGR1_9FUNG|nr:hypothetical protein BC938DRAFT_481241 [Jimgerdemannia flammicorona]